MTQDEFNAWIRARFNLWTKSDVDAEVRKEREACAKVVDARLEKWLSLFGKKDKMYKWMIDLPKIIRARGE